MQDWMVRPTIISFSSFNVEKGFSQHGVYLLAIVTWTGGIGAI